MIQGEIGHGDGVVGAVSVCEAEGEKKPNKQDGFTFTHEWTKKPLPPPHFHLVESEWKKSSRWEAMMTMMIKVVTYGVVGREVVPPHAGAGRAAAVPAPLQSGHAGCQSPRNKPLQFLPFTARSLTPFTLKSVLAGIYFIPKKMQVIQSAWILIDLCWSAPIDPTTDQSVAAFTLPANQIQIRFLLNF